MVLYPEAQVKARRELDAVVGSSRLPEYSDREFLPYIEAIVSETLRWHPVVPLGNHFLDPFHIQIYSIHSDIPHQLSADDVYGGYFLPKGSIIVGNAW